MIRFPSCRYSAVPIRIYLDEIENLQCLKISPRPIVICRNSTANCKFLSIEISFRVCEYSKMYQCSGRTISESGMRLRRQAWHPQKKQTLRITDAGRGRLAILSAGNHFHLVLGGRNFPKFSLGMIDTSRPSLLPQELLQRHLAGRKSSRFIAFALSVSQLMTPIILPRLTDLPPQKIARPHFIRPCFFVNSPMSSETSGVCNFNQLSLTSALLLHDTQPIISMRRMIFQPPSPRMIQSCLEVYWLLRRTWE
jgi:hypothetical protein